MIFKVFRVFGWFETGKTLYEKILKPVYLDLRKDAYEGDTNTEVVKRTSNTKRKTSKKNVVDQRSKRSN